MRQSQTKMTSSSDARAAKAIRQIFGDLMSAECALVCFIWSGRLKALPELRIIDVDLAVVFLSITVILYLKRVLLEKKFPTTIGQQDVMIIVFLCYVLLSYTWSSEQTANIEKLWRILFLVCPCYFIPSMFLSQRDDLARFLRVLILLSVSLLFYYGYYRFVFGVEPVITFYSELAEVYGFVNTHFVYAFHAWYLFVIFFCIAVTTKVPRIFFAAVAASTFALAALLLIGARGPLFYAIAAVPMFFVLVLTFGRTPMRQTAALLRYVVIACVLAGMVAAAINIFSNIEVAVGEAHTLDRINLWLEAGQTDDSLDARFEAQEFALQKWPEMFLTGWGIGEFAVMHSLVYPHDLFIEILMELGLLGFVLWSLICFNGVRYCVTIFKTTGAEWAGLAVVLLFITELFSRAAGQGYLADERALFAFLGAVTAYHQVVTSGRAYSPTPGDRISLRSRRRASSLDSDTATKSL